MRSELKTKILFEKDFQYCGPELRAHFILQNTGIEGNALVAYQGPCDVKTDHLVDWEDRLAADSIKAKKMIHILGEFFGVTLIEGVWIQRLLVAHFASELAAKGVTRDGDDLFANGKKLSVSIVAPHAAGCVLHLGINIDSTGAPVAAIGLNDLGVKPEDLVAKVFAAFQQEWSSVSRSCVKVRPVV